PIRTGCHGNRDHAHRGRPAARPVRRHPGHTTRRVTRQVGDHVSQERMRPRSVRIVHRAAERTQGDDVSDLRGRVRRLHHHHERRTAGRRRPPFAAPRVPRPRRLPVRLLHTRPDLLRRRTAGRGRSGLAQRGDTSGHDRPHARRRGDPGTYQREPVPLRGVSRHRGGSGVGREGPGTGSHAQTAGRDTMIPFEYSKATDAEAAVRTVTGNGRAAYLAGGTNLVDHMKLGITAPELLVDITGLSLDAIEELPDGGVRIGAGARNSDVAAHPLVRSRYPVLSQALLQGASGQLRNLATVGGNLLQRTRCVYFQDITTPCNKRSPGEGCSALDGYTRYHAVLGASSHCVAVHPSDLAVALTALDAVVRIRTADGERTVPAAELHRLPGEHPERDTVLEH